jgi:cephalosporin-C deacetylase
MPDAPAPRFSHDFPFDPTYGCDQEALLRIGSPEGPADFDAFWRGLHATARNVAPNPTLRPAGRLRGFDVFDVTFTSLGGQRIGGWLTRPRRGSVRRGVVVGHGYGGRDAPDDWLPMPHAAALFPCLRGQSRSRTSEIPPEAFDHVLHGIESRDTYVHGGCAADLWAAATALTQLVPEAARRLDYIGGSFGGGIGALALPWDDRFRAAHLAVPSFGNHPLRLTLPCVGSGESVRTYYRDHPEVVDVLAYFDAATAARRIHIPVLVAAALFDPAVPPPGQFAVYNALPGPKELFTSSAGHFDYHGAAAEGRRLRGALERFFADPELDHNA